MADTKPLDQPWEEVSIRLVYADGPKLGHRDINLVRSEIEQTERASRLHELSTLDLTEEERAPAIEDAEAHTVTPEDFQRRILGNIEHMLNTPLKVPGKKDNAFRILPPSAIVEVVVTVNPKATKILVPGRD